MILRLFLLTKNHDYLRNLKVWIYIWVRRRGSSSKNLLAFGTFLALRNSRSHDTEGKTHYSLGRFPPYFERPCLRPATPAESKLPRTIW